MHDRYVSPLSERYASREMQYIFSPEKKFCTWRRLWVALAEAENELGLPVTKEQIDELKEHMDDINFDVAKEREKLVPCIRIRRSVPEGQGNYPSGRYLLLRWRQHGYYYYGRCPEAGEKETDQRDGRAG